ncbi:putative ATP-binding protein [Acrasis kona]|uniref:ATP-binding protein n=1 Tax=Acrasis kona TaxID=1008807 RepID=A0AAW2YXC9_9EUKA
MDREGDTWWDFFKYHSASYIRDNLATAVFAGVGLVGSIVFATASYQLRWNPVFALEKASNFPLPSNPKNYYSRRTLEDEVLKIWMKEKTYSMVYGDSSIGKTTLVVNVAHKMREQFGTKFIYFECQQGTSLKFVEKFAQQLNFEFTPNHFNIREGLVKYLLHRFEIHESSSEVNTEVKDERMIGDIFDFLIVASSKLSKSVNHDAPCYIIIIDNINALSDIVIRELREGAKRLTHQSVIHLCLVTRYDSRVLQHVMALDVSRLNTIEVPELTDQEAIEHLENSGVCTSCIDAEEYVKITGGQFSFLRFIDTNVPLETVRAKVSYFLDRRLMFSSGQIKKVSLFAIMSYVHSHDGCVSCAEFLDVCCQGDLDLYLKLTRNVFSERYRSGYGVVQFKDTALSRYVGRFLEQKKTISKRTNEMKPLILQADEIMIPSLPLDDEVDDVERKFNFKLE